MHSYSLYELNEYIKRVIALNFNEPIWVNAEISQVSEVRGQVFLDLIQHDEENGKTVAQSNAIIWYKSYLFIKKKLGDLLPAILKEGSHVMVKVSVEFDERYGLKLIISDIDASYTIGQMEMARQKILERLEKDGLIEKNKERGIPEVIQKVAIISSGTAAGYRDFIKQLTTNSFGYQFKLDLFPSAMQGANVEKDVIRAIDHINRLEGYDCIVIIRGGGSKLDLSYFDNYNIAAAIAHNALPVLTGIGHDIDQSVADVVAKLALKTPTAVADYILERNLNFESEIIQSGTYISNWSRQLIHNHRLRLSNFQSILSIQPMQLVKAQNDQLDQRQNEVKRLTLQLIKEKKLQLTHLESVIQIGDPVQILKKGFAIIQKDSTILQSSSQAEKGDELKIKMHDGEIKTKVYE